MRCWHRPHSNEDTSEKQYLRGHAPKWSVPCLIHSRRALTFCTRLAFTATIFTGFAVIFASIWFMLDCRQNFRSIHALIPKHSSFCTNLGMQALFACCVLLFTIFGLGCIGRRMTGHAILIISGVAIFQGAMTLVFYQCRAMADDDIVKAVNSTLASCHVGMGPPFVPVMSATFAVPGYGSSSGRRSGAKGKRVRAPAAAASQDHDVTKTAGSNDEGGYFRDAPPPPPPQPASDESDIHQGVTANSSWCNDMEKLNRDLKRKLAYSIKVNEVKEIPKIAHLISAPLKIINCDEKSIYFVALAKVRNNKDVQECQRVCETYESFCLGRDVSVDSGRKSVAATTIAAGANAGGRRHDVTSNSLAGEFQHDAVLCGEEIARYVRHFCIYDNRIFTPLSLGTPIFYMFMSFCFIYLARCDRQIKDDDVSEHCTGDLRPGSSSSSKCLARSLSKGKDKKADSGYSSSSSPFGRQRQDDKSMLPSPAQSDASSSWGGDLELGREQSSHELEVSQHLSQHSSSARTLETILGYD